MAGLSALSPGGPGEQHAGLRAGGDPADWSRGAARAVLALDIGGTDIKGAVLDEGGILYSRTSSTRAKDGPAASLGAVHDAVAHLLSRVPPSHRAVGVGLAVPGTVDEDEARVVSAENLDWVDLPLGAIVAERCGLPVAFGHDVRTAGLAEWRLGAGRGASDLAYVSIGTGIAAAIVLHGELIVSHGYSGEIGHGGAKGGEQCACGGHGCAETYASAAGIARQYNRLAGASVPGAKEVLAAAEAGDTVAGSVWDAAIDRLGQLISELVRVTGLRTVVVGGGLIRAGDALMLPLAGATAEYLTIHPRPQLVPAQLGSRAGTYGAALLAWQAAGLDLPAAWSPAR